VNITLDRQIVSQRCPECEVDFPVVRGSVYDDGEPFGLYFIVLHGHSPQGRLGHLAVAILDRSGDRPQPRAVAMDVISLPEQFAFSVIDWASSPWQREAYLGEMLDREQVLASPHRPTFFHVAEHVLSDLPEVRAYFAS
jgi:hypothetical protein